MVNDGDFFIKEQKIVEFKLDSTILKTMEQMCWFSAKRKKIIATMQSCGENQTLKEFKWWPCWTQWWLENYIGFEQNTITRKYVRNVISIDKWKNLENVNLDLKQESYACYNTNVDELKSMETNLILIIEFHYGIILNIVSPIEYKIPYICVCVCVCVCVC